MDGGAWQATVHRVAKEDTTEWLNNNNRGIIVLNYYSWGQGKVHEAHIHGGEEAKPWKDFSERLFLFQVEMNMQFNPFPRFSYF